MSGARTHLAAASAWLTLYCSTAAIICSIALQGTALLGSYAHKYIAHQREQRRIRLGSEDDAAARLQEAEAEAGESAASARLQLLPC